MNPVILLLQKLSQMVAVFLVGVLFFATLGFGLQGQALAKPLTPEARSYQSPPADTRLVDKTAEQGTDLIENTQDKLKDMADTVREKLNLDEPLPKSTKKFINSVEDAVDGDGMSPEYADDYHY